MFMFGLIAGTLAGLSLATLAAIWVYKHKRHLFEKFVTEASDELGI